MNDNMIAALKRERAAYEADGKADLVRQVDEQLAHYGYEPALAALAGPDGGPKGRGGPVAAQQTAAADSGPGTGDGDGDAKKNAAKKTAAAKKTTVPPQK